MLQAFWMSNALGQGLDGAAWESAMSAYHERRDSRLGLLFEQTVAAVSARDIPRSDLTPLRAVLVNQHDARILVNNLPSLLEQAFSPMDRMRHAFIAQMFDRAEVAAEPAKA